MIVRCAHTELVDIDLLVPHPLNPNNHPERQIKFLAKIMAHQGWRHPITVSTRSGFIVAGHGRLLAAKLNGWSQVPVDRQDFETEADEYAHLVADNKISELADVDLAMINRDVAQFGPDLDLDLLGIPDFVVEPAEKFAPQADDDEIPERPETRTKPGDLYRLGDHRLLCGDSTMADHMARLMGEDRADMVFTDPPYNVDYTGKTKEALKIQNDKMDAESFRRFLTDAFTALFMFTKPGGAIYVAHADSEGYNFRGALVDSGFLLKQCLIWVKQSIVMGRQDYHWQHEPILYGWADGGSHSWHGDRKQSTVWNIDRPTKSEEHPTMKPVELVEKALANSTQYGDIVLDAFGGTTMIAAQKIGRKARLIELDPHYCDVIVARWEKYTGQKAELIDG